MYESEADARQHGPSAGLAGVLERRRATPAEPREPPLHAAGLAVIPEAGGMQQPRSPSALPAPARQRLMAMHPEGGPQLGSSPPVAIPSASSSAFRKHSGRQQGLAVGPSGFGATSADLLHAGASMSSNGSGGGLRAGSGGGGSSGTSTSSGLVPLRGSLAKASAPALTAVPGGLAPTIALPGVNVGTAPESPFGPSGALSAAPTSEPPPTPSSTPLSSSLSQGFGMPSWLLKAEQAQQQDHASTPQQPDEACLETQRLAGTATPPCTAHPRPHPQRASPFLPNPQPMLLPPQSAEQQQLQQQWRSAAQPAPQAVRAGQHHSHVRGGGHEPHDEGFDMARSAPVRGRSSMPRVASISEIEPVFETDDPPRASSSLLTRAMMIPSCGGLDRPRTYRVAHTRSQGSHDDVTVVLEDAEGGAGDADRPGAAGGSVRGGRAFGGVGGSHHGSHHSLGSSGGGAGAVLGPSLLSGSLLSGSLLGGLFGSRATGGGAAGSGAGGLLRLGSSTTPDSSVHGPDSLPFGNRDRLYHHAASDPSFAFGSLPTPSSSLLRARAANVSAGSVLCKATGGLNTSMKRATSYGQFGSLTGQGSSASGMRQPRHSLNGGSDSSSLSAGGLGAWMRGVSIPRGSRASGVTGGSGASVGAGGVGGSGDSAGAAPVSGRPSEPDLADLAVLATSLPASLGTWSLPRSVALGSSPHGGGVGSGSAGGTRILSRANSSLSAATSGYAGGSGAGGAGVGLAGTNAYPICLICLEVLSPEDFERGDAMALQCACKGEVALRHRKCAIEWSHHKGDVVCDICKQPINNLPPIPDEVLAAREAARRRRQPAFSTSADPNFADYMFDAIRATWVTMIVCVLLFDFSIGQAFMAGALAGVAFALVSMVLAACARRARALTAARAVERAAAESREAERREQEQRLQVRRQQGVVSFASGAGGEPAGSGLTQPLLAEAHDVV